MILSTTEKIPGYEVTEVLGVISANVITSKHLGRDLAAVLKSLIGGELKGYTEMMTEARNEALERLIGEAEKMGADAIIGLRFSSSYVMSGAAEILVYGTAVKIRRVD